MSRHYRNRMVWSAGSIHPEASRNLDRVLREWARTPYGSGQRLKGVAADCIGAVFGVIDEIDGRERAACGPLPQDAAMHDRPGALAAMRTLIRRYEPAERVRSRFVEPGDLVVLGEQGGGPGHLGIIGARRNEFWHATAGPGFHQAGWTFPANQRVVGVFRLGDRDRWA